jgi:predicted metal-dependent peptidase
VSAFDVSLAVAAAHYVAQLADVVFWTCDTRPVRHGSELPAYLPGGGGTDLRNGINAAIADGAAAVVVITDCMTPWPMVDVGVPLIVGANPSSEAARSGRHPQWQPPEWATVIPVVPDGFDGATV